MIFNPEYECMDKQARQQIQLASLKNLAETLYSKCLFTAKSLTKQK